MHTADCGIYNDIKESNVAIQVYDSVWIRAGKDSEFTDIHIAECGEVLLIQHCNVLAANKTKKKQASKKIFALYMYDGESVVNCFVEEFFKQVTPINYLPDSKYIAWLR